MQRQAQPKAKEEKGPMISMKLGGGIPAKTKSGGGFKKGGFKNAFAAVDDDGDEVMVKKEAPLDAIPNKIIEEAAAEEEDSDMTDAEDYYDPRKPTGCHPGCMASSRTLLS